jgi:hypothetical protein
MSSSSDCDAPVAMPADVVRGLVRALPPPEGAGEEWRFERIKGAVDALAALQPRDPIEAMLAAQVIATHAAAMECYRIATSGEVGDEAARRQRVAATGLIRCMDGTLRTLRQRQAQKLAVIDGAMAVPEVNDELVETLLRKPVHREAAAATPTRVEPPAFMPYVPPRVVELMTPAERRAFYGYPEDVNAAAEAALAKREGKEPVAP